MNNVNPAASNEVLPWKDAVARHGFVVSALASACEVRYSFSDYDERHGNVSFGYELGEDGLSGHFDELGALATGIVAATRITTARGEVRADEIVRGDMVLTRSNGMQPVTWVAHRHLDWKVLGLVPALRPRQIPVAGLGAMCPSHPVELAPAQRFAASVSDISSLRAQGAENRFAQVSSENCHLVLIMFDDMQLIHCEGLWLESFEPNHLKSGLLAEADRMELMLLQQMSIPQT